MRPDTPQAISQGLRDFSSKVADLRAAQAATPEGLSLRLKTFARKLKRIAAEEPAPSLPPADRVRASMHAIAEAHQRCRESGEFIDVWSLAGLGRNEVRTAAVLAWLMRPREPHGLQDRVMQELWARVGAPAPLGRILSCRAEVYPALDERNRVDIVVETTEAVILVEVKIDAQEGPEQLTRYVESGKRLAAALGRAHSWVLYIAPRSPGRDDVHHVDWFDVAHSIRSAVRGLEPEGFSARLALQFADHVQTLHRRRHEHRRA